MLQNDYKETQNNHKMMQNDHKETQVEEKICSTKMKCHFFILETLLREVLPVLTVF